MRKGLPAIAGLVVFAAGCGRLGFEAGTDGAGTGPGDGPDDGLAPPSCMSLPATCGPMGTSPCCESPMVSGGTFYRSYDPATDGMYPSMANPATVSAFRLDKYEVTVARFRQFVAAGQGTRQTPPRPGAGAHPNIPGSGWNASWNASLAIDTAALISTLNCDATYQTWTDVPGGNESRPVNCINWYEAIAFCTWDGGYLPTEAEWNYAAAGGSQQRAYPWSSPPPSLALDSSRASYQAGTDCTGDGLPGCALTDLTAVGTKPAGDGMWGQSDLGGNVREWTLDSYATSYTNPCTDCVDLATTQYRVLRGGSFRGLALYLRAGDRGYAIVPPSGYGNEFGIRCARAP